MTVASLSEKNIDLICALYKTDFSDGWNKEMLISAFNTGRFFCAGAFDGEQLIGVITCSKSVDDADLEGIVTAKDYRNKGVAEALFDYAKDALKSAGVEKLFLEVRESNAPAIGFYIKNGFKKISVRKKYYADGENALVFVKEL